MAERVLLELIVTANASAASRCMVLATSTTEREEAMHTALDAVIQIIRSYDAQTGRGLMDRILDADPKMGGVRIKYAAW